MARRRSLDYHHRVYEVSPEGTCFWEPRSLSMSSSGMRYVLDLCGLFARDVICELRQVARRLGLSFKWDHHGSSGRIYFNTSRQMLRVIEELGYRWSLV